MQLRDIVGSIATVGLEQRQHAIELGTAVLRSEEEEKVGRREG